MDKTELNVVDEIFVQLNSSIDGGNNEITVRFDVILIAAKEDPEILSKVASRLIEYLKCNNNLDVAMEMGKILLDLARENSKIISDGIEELIRKV